MKRQGRSAKTAALFGRGRRSEAYSFSKRIHNIPDIKKIVERVLNFFMKLFWTYLYHIQDYALKMISAEKSPSSKKNNPKQNKETKPKTNLSRKNAGNNWENVSDILIKPAESKVKDPNKSNYHTKKAISTNVTKYIAMDCEMVGVGPGGQDDMLARVSLVNQKGEILLDKYVKPREPVTDYRTEVSGIRPKDIECAEEFDKVQDDVVNIIQGNIIVGHSIKKDLAVLFINHPPKYIRDTAKYRPLAKLVSNGATPSLKRLSKSILGLDIQDGEHDSVEDAKATMAIYNRFSADWEKHLKKLAQRQKGHHKHGHGHGRKT